MGNPEPRIENSPCGYITLQTSGRIAHVNKTLLGWTGHTADDMIGKRFTDLVNMAGRIYYETHIAPLLRMQGFFNEFTISIATSLKKPFILSNGAMWGS